jgi:hypothetical protein
VLVFNSHTHVVLRDELNRRRGSTVALGLERCLLMPSPTGAETSGAAFNGARKNPRKNVKILNERQKRPRKRAACIAEIKMRKTLVTILCSALIAASSIQAAAAAEHHHTRKASRKPVMVNDQHRNPNNEQPRDSNVSGTCGIFPGPCQ